MKPKYAPIEIPGKPGNPAHKSVGEYDDAKYESGFYGIALGPTSRCASVSCCRLMKKRLFQGTA